MAAGPAPSPWITLSPTGYPLTITAFKTPSILATYESFREAQIHMEQIKVTKPSVLPFHYIKENKNEVWWIKI